MKHKKSGLHILRRTAFFPALALALSLLVPAAGATCLGTDLTRDSLAFSDTAGLSAANISNGSVRGGRQAEHLIEYRPESGLRPIVAYGSSLYGRSDVNYVANYLAGRGLSAAAAVNGSFFSMANGVPMGCVITEGVVRSSGNDNAVGFRADGTAVIGAPGLAIRVTYPDGTTPITHYNKVATRESGLTLYSRDYDTHTKNKIECYNLVLAPESASIVPGKSFSAQVQSIAQSTASCDIPEGRMVLSIALDTEYQTALDSIKGCKVGDKLTISCAIGPAWADVVYACGGGEILVENGTARTEFTLDSADQAAARTAVGLKADGTLVLYTIDGRQSGYSYGLTLANLARRMAEQGCVTALNLDGGGSTTFAVRRPGEGALTTLNRPSDGSLRKCANFIFLARETAPAGQAAHLHLYPYDAAVLSKARLSLTVKASDALWQAVLPPGGISYAASSGSVSEGGVFTAGPAGTATITATAANGASGTRAIRVVDTPTALSVKNEQGQSVTTLTCTPGQRVDLSAVALFNGYTLVAQDDCFTWSASEGIGAIDSNGVFTAAASTSAASGTIVCAAGSASAAVNVQVAALPPEGGAAYGFEPDEPDAAGGAGLLVSKVDGEKHVRYGERALRVQYDLSESAAGTGAAQVRGSFSVTVPGNCDHAGLWVYGDNSNNSLSLLLDGESGAGFKWLTQLNFSGWKYVLTELPAGTRTLTGFAVTSYKDATGQSGTIYLDQLILSAGALTDTTPPAVTVSIQNGALDVALSDSGSGVGHATVSIDGRVQLEQTGKPSLHLALPTDGAAHRVRVTAADRCGNLAARSVEASGTLANPFSDTEDHWARSYAAYCARQDILKGSAGGQGGQRFRPDDPMSRQEFAVALVRFLGVEADAYADVALPFADTAQIDSWALNAMKAAYKLGLITGSRTNGALCALPKSPISRQEAVVILGRTQPRGYAPADLSRFSDRARVGAWAETYVASMVGQGILSGSHGRLDPTGLLTRGQVAKILCFLY